MATLRDSKIESIKVVNRWAIALKSVPFLFGRGDPKPRGFSEVTIDCICILTLEGMRFAHSFVLISAKWLMKVTEGAFQPGDRSMELAAEYEVGVPAVIGSNIGRD